MKRTPHGPFSGSEREERGWSGSLQIRIDRATCMFVCEASLDIGLTL
jgi:hypothetical protein